MVAESLKPKVLLIDDDPLMHRLYQPHIERAGYEVIGLMEGSDAYQVANREQPQAIVIDMLMPGVDGLAAIMLLKAAESTRGIPVIAISGEQSYHGLRQQLESIGVEVFLSKPFGAVKLVSELRRLEQGTKQTRADRPGTGGVNQPTNLAG